MRVQNTYVHVIAVKQKTQKKHRRIVNLCSLPSPPHNRPCAPTNSDERKTCCEYHRPLFTYTIPSITPVLLCTCCKHLNNQRNHPCAALMALYLVSLICILLFPRQVPVHTLFKTYLPPQKNKSAHHNSKIKACITSIPFRTGT